MSFINLFKSKNYDEVHLQKIANEYNMSQHILVYKDHELSDIVLRNYFAFMVDYKDEDEFLTETDYYLLQVHGNNFISSRLCDKQEINEMKKKDNDYFNCYDLMTINSKNGWKRIYINN